MKLKKLHILRWQTFCLLLFLVLVGSSVTRASVFPQTIAVDEAARPSATPDDSGASTPTKPGVVSKLPDAVQALMPSIVTVTKVEPVDAALLELAGLRALSRIGVVVDSRGYIAIPIVPGPAKHFVVRFANQQETMGELVAIDDSINMAIDGSLKLGILKIENPLPCEAVSLGASRESRSDERVLLVPFSASQELRSGRILSNEFDLGEGSTRLIQADIAFSLSDVGSLMVSEAGEPIGLVLCSSRTRSRVGWNSFSFSLPMKAIQPALQAAIDKPKVIPITVIQSQPAMDVAKPVQSPAVDSEMPDISGTWRIGDPIDGPLLEIRRVPQGEIDFFIDMPWINEFSRVAVKWSADRQRFEGEFNDDDDQHRSPFTLQPQADGNSLRVIVTSRNPSKAKQSDPSDTNTDKTEAYVTQIWTRTSMTFATTYPAEESGQPEATLPAENPTQAGMLGADGGTSATTSKEVAPQSSAIPDTPAAKQLVERLAAQESAAASAANEIRRLQTNGASVETIAPHQAQLKAYLQTTFDLKMQLEELQVKELQSRLSRLERQIGQRKALREKIIARRAADLLNPDMNWDTKTNISPAAVSSVPEAADPAIEGEWRLESISGTVGHEINLKARIVGSRWDMIRDGEVFTIGLKVDPTESPKTIDMIVIGVDGTEFSRELGIYQIQNETLRIAWSAGSRNGSRPTSFDPNHARIHIWKRVGEVPTSPTHVNSVSPTSTASVNVPNGLTVTLPLLVERYSEELLRSQVGFTGISLYAENVQVTTAEGKSGPATVVLAHECRLDAFEPMADSNGKLWAAKFYVLQGVQADGSNQELTQKTADNLAKKGAIFVLDHLRMADPDDPAAGGLVPTTTSSDFPSGRTTGLTTQTYPVGSYVTEIFFQQRINKGTSYDVASLTEEADAIADKAEELISLVSAHNKPAAVSFDAVSLQLVVSHSEAGHRALNELFQTMGLPMDRNLTFSQFKFTSQLDRLQKHNTVWKEVDQLISSAEESGWLGAPKKDLLSWHARFLKSMANGKDPGLVSPLILSAGIPYSFDAGEMRVVLTSRINPADQKAQLRVDHTSLNGQPAGSRIISDLLETAPFVHGGEEAVIFLACEESADGETSISSSHTLTQEGVRVNDHRVPGIEALAADSDKASLQDTEMVSFQGTWCFDVLQSDGWPKPIGEPTDSSGRKSQQRWIIKGDRISWTSLDNEQIEVSFTIDPTTTPKQIDFTFLSGPQKGMKSIGIYEPQKGNANYLWLCMTNPGTDAPRPTEVGYSSEKQQSMIGIYPVAPSEKAEVAESLKRFQGDWQMTLCDSTLDGFGSNQDEVKTWTWTIEGDTVLWGRDQEGWELKLDVETSKSPGELDLTYLTGPFKGAKCLGMFQWGGVDNSQLMIAIQDPGSDAPRPTQFSMNSDVKTGLMILEPRLNR